MSKTSNLNQKVLAVTTAATLSLGIAGTASAGGIAFSSLVIENFTWHNVEDADNDGIDADDIKAPLQASDFDRLQVGDTAKGFASLDLSALGLPTNTTSSIPLSTVHRSANPPIDTHLGVANPDLYCVDSVGNDCAPIPQDKFTEVGGATKLFSRSDSLLKGSIITPGGATAKQAAEIQLNRLKGNASAGAHVSNSSEISFKLASAGRTAFTLDATGAFHVEMYDQDRIKTEADRSFAITIEDNNNNVVFRWISDGSKSNFSNGVELNDPYALNDGVSELDRGFKESVFSTLEPSPLFGGDDDPFNTPFKIVTPVLGADQGYTLTIASNVNSAVQLEPSQRETIPAPATLALLGAGLLGMGAAFRRRKSKV